MSDDMVKVGDTGEYQEWLEAERRKREKEDAEFIGLFPIPEPSFFEKLALRLWLAKKRVKWFFDGKLDKIRRRNQKE